MASCVEAGPGSRLVAAIPSSNSSSAQPAVPLDAQRIGAGAMWAGGPPNPMHADAAPLVRRWWPDGDRRSGSLTGARRATGTGASQDGLAGHAEELLVGAAPLAELVGVEPGVGEGVAAAATAAVARGGWRGRPACRPPPRR